MASEEGWIDILGDGGILKRIKKEGTRPANIEIDEPHPPKGTEVSVHYVGTLVSDGSKFDSSRDRNEPFKFKLGQGQVIKGWDQGVGSMLRGEIADFKLRFDYAYGASGSPPTIPPNADLMFEIELLDWNSWENIGPKEAPHLIKKRVEQEGEGWQRPKSGATVVVSYNSVELANKQPLEGKQDFSFEIGDEAVSAALEKAVKSMKVKEKAKFKMAPKICGVDSEVLYSVELLSLESAKSPESLPGKERLALCDKLRTRGNTFFTAHKLDLARKKYKSAYKMVEYTDNGFTPEEKEQAKKLRVVCNLNLALVMNKMQKYKEAITCCEKALNDDSSNVKALYRRGQAHKFLNDFVAARTDFTAALNSDPNNTEVKNELARVEAEIAKQKQKEKAVYSRMFSAIGEEQ